jgi:hypothetical protein
MLKIHTGDADRSQVARKKRPIIDSPEVKAASRTRQAGSQQPLPNLEIKSHSAGPQLSLARSKTGRM